MARLAKRIVEEDEDGIAIAVADFLRAALPGEIVWWHTPNGGSRASREVYSKRLRKMIRISPEAARFKKMGVLAGVPDLTFVLPNGQVAFIELKTATGELSDEQIELRGRLTANRCGYEVARSVQDVERILTRWLALYDLKLNARSGPLFSGRAA